MQLLIAILIVLGSVLLSLFSYVNRLYGEKGRFLIRGSKDNVEFFEEQVEPRLKISLERAEFTFPLLVRTDLVLLTLLAAAWDLGEVLRWSTMAEVAVFLLLDVVLFAQVVPNVLLTRTSGRWLLPLAGFLRLCTMLVAPLVFITQFLHHVATLGNGQEHEENPPTPEENIEALMHAGEEEGLLEADDRKLIRSVVEFGDKTVREVMTPRPEMFTVSADATPLDLKRMLAKRHYSRIPVYEGDLDHILGFVHALDLFALSDAELAGGSVRRLLRPVSFVPETKPVADLLRELRQKAHIAIVIDEYGSVAGLVTVEDMVEEIVGEIRDEHEALDVLPQGEGAYSVPGSMDLDRLQELFGVRIEEPEEATTVGGLVTGAMGRVPGPGETLQRDGLLFRVTESNGRRVLRLSISEAPPVAQPSSSGPSQERDS